MIRTVFIVSHGTSIRSMYAISFGNKTTLYPPLPRTLPVYSAKLKYRSVFSIHIQRGNATDYVRVFLSPTSATVDSCRFTLIFFLLLVRVVFSFRFSLSFHTDTSHHSSKTGPEKRAHTVNQREMYPPSQARSVEYQPQ